MTDLHSLDRALALLDQNRMSALDLSRVAAIQSGAFLCAHHHAKFDLSKSGLCPVCGVPDTVQHRICCCPQFAAARAEHAWVVEEWHLLPVCLSHLLPPENPFLPELVRELRAIVDSTAAFHSLDSVKGRQNLFSDGSCLWPEIPELALASWGLISASTGKVLGCGHVAGELQTTPRAELTAAIAAVKWARHTGQSVTLWCDAKHVVDGLQYLLSGGFSPSLEDNHDLWDELQTSLAEVEPDGFWVKHVPSHIDINRCESPLEEWVAVHNQHADQVAGIANRNRPHSLAQVRDRALAHHLRTVRTIRALRSIFCAIAAVPADTAQGQAEYVERIVGVSEPVVCEEPLVDQLPVGWMRQLSGQTLKVPQAFIESVWHFILRQDMSSEVKRRVSFLELVFMVHFTHGLVSPAICPRSGGWVEAQQVPFRPERLNLAVQLKLFRDAAALVLRMCGLRHLMVSGISLVDCGVVRPCDGLVMGVVVSEFFDAREGLSSFAARRPIPCARSSST